MSKTTATKAITVFLTGATTWAGVNLPAAVAGAVGVITATVLAFLVPNAPTAEPPPMTLRLGHMDSGQANLGGLVTFLIGFILGVLCAKAGIFGTG